MITYPATPPLSIWLANVTSSLQTSNCHFRKPNTPHSTFPVCTPIRISTLNPVASRTNLNEFLSGRKNKKQNWKKPWYLERLFVTFPFIIFILFPSHYGKKTKKEKDLKRLLRKHRTKENKTTSRYIFKLSNGYC